MEKNRDKLNRGRWAEQRVSEYFDNLGYCLFRRNFRWKFPFQRNGQTLRIESDLIFVKNDHLLIAEVKFRKRADAFSGNWQFLNDRQLSRLLKVKCYAASKFPKMRISLVLLWVDEKGVVHFLQNY